MSEHMQKKVGMGKSYALILFLRLVVEGPTSQPCYGNVGKTFSLAMILISQKS